MFDKKTRLRIRTFHRWLGAAVGIQLTIWVVSGVYFAWISIESIRGDINKVKADPPPIILNEVLAPKDLLVPSDFFIKNLRIESSPRGTVYRVESTAEKISVFDAKTGSKLQYLSEEEARALGLSQVRIDGKPLSSVLVTEKGGEYKGPVPAYKIELDDVFSTRLYLDPWTGKLIVQRNVLWRVYDFFWMLHIMDYSDRENFNNKWIKGISLAAFGIVVTGYLLFLFGRFNRRSARG